MRKIQGCFPPEQFLSLYCFQIFLMMKKRKTCWLLKVQNKKLQMQVAACLLAAILSITFFFRISIKRFKGLYLLATSTSQGYRKNLLFMKAKKNFLDQNVNSYLGKINIPNCIFKENCELFLACCLRYSHLTNNLKSFKHTMILIVFKRFFR